MQLEYFLYAGALPYNGKASGTYSAGLEQKNAVNNRLFHHCYQAKPYCGVAQNKQLSFELFYYHHKGLHENYLHLLCVFGHTQEVLGAVSSVLKIYFFRYVIILCCKKYIIFFNLVSVASYESLAAFCSSFIYNRKTKFNSTSQQSQSVDSP